MTETTSPHPSIAERHFFLLRRLHSLCGIVPVGVFLCVHMAINATMMAGASSFQNAVDVLHLLERIKLLEVVEIVGIFLPLLFHAVLGVKIWLSGTSNVGNYRYAANFRYTAQRVTGVIAFAFILYHVWHVHWLGKALGGALFDPEHAALTAAAAIQKSAWIAPVYAVGVIAACFHLANGVWTFLITWGITVGRRSQRLTGYTCAALGVVLLVFGLGSLRSLKTFDVPDVAQVVEADAPMVTGSPHGP